MAANADPRLRRVPVHRPVERPAGDGRTRISCAGPRCAAWDPRPFASRREAQFWYERHVTQPLTHSL